MKFESYYTAKASHDLVFKYCGYEECTANFVMNPHTRSEYLIHYVTKGCGSFTCEDNTYEISKGDLFLICPSQLVSYQSYKENPLQFSWFAFSGEKARETVFQLGFHDYSPVRKLHAEYSIDNLVKSFVELLESVAPCNDFTVQSILYNILSHIAESYSLTRNYTKENRDIILEHIGKAKSYIKYNYNHPISVKDVVAHVGLERSYFSKIFKKYTGMTAQNYILDIRIQKSKLLLKRTNYSIREISSYVGIMDEYYFSRAFKKSQGISPSLYREINHDEI